MLKIKKILNDLVDNTYKDSDKIEEYKRFYVEMSPDTRKSFHGVYNIKTHRITIYNLYRDDASVVATTIHELAHHIDNCNRGDTDHQKEFYVEYQKLLYMALNMKLFSKNEFLNATRDASDSKKVARMIADYEPTDIGYKKDMITIEVHRGYEIREKLKNNGYMLNSINKTWEKEINLEEVAEEKRFLEDLGAEYDVNKNNNISFQKKTYIIASKGSYEYKEALKAEGFSYWSKDKSWKKEGTKDDVRKYTMKYPKVKFTLV